LDFWQVIEARRSIRSYETGLDVPPSLVNRILNAAIRAPSAGNRQPWHFVVVRKAEVRRALAHRAAGQSFIAQAPVVIVVCADGDRSAARYRERGRRLYCLQDTAAAITHLLLAVTALRLGACWIGAFDEGEATEILDLPSHLRPVAMISIGFPAEVPSPRSRRGLGEVVRLID